MTTNANNADQEKKEVEVGAVVKRALVLFGIGRKRGDKLMMDEVEKLSPRHRVALENSGKIVLVRRTDDLLRKPTAVAGAGNQPRPQQRGGKK